MASQSRSALIETIRGIPMFSHLTNPQLKKVADRFVSLEYAPGSVILKQLEEAQLMVAILSGRARVARDGKTLARVEAGDVVGEMALVDGQRRSAAVIAETEVTALGLHRSAFMQLLEEVPTVTLKLLMAQTARLREADKRLGALG